VNTNGARFAVLAARIAIPGFEGDAGGTTTLIVLNNVSGRLAGVHRLAGGTIGHAIVALNIGIVVRGDLVGVDRHSTVVLARDCGLAVQLTSNTLVLERALGDRITLAE
jgi:hypothetical protein